MHGGCARTLVSAAELAEPSRQLDRGQHFTHLHLRRRLGRVLRTTQGEDAVKRTRPQTENVRSRVRAELLPRARLRAFSMVKIIDSYSFM